MLNSHPAGQPTLDAIDRLRRTNPKRLYCTVCGALKEAFGPGGAVAKRTNAKCPECGSLERHRLLWLHLFDQVWPRMPQRKKDVLHVAPEPFLADHLRSRDDVNYVSGDLMMSGSMAKLDLTDICFWDGQFDLVLCSHVLEHIPDDDAAMREMYRILRPGGCLVAMVPIHGDTTYEDAAIVAPEERLKHFGQEDHVRRYGRDIRARLETAGFGVRFWPEEDEVGPDIRSFVRFGRRFVIECQK